MKCSASQSPGLLSLHFRASYSGSGPSFLRASHLWRAPETLYRVRLAGFWAHTHLLLKAGISFEPPSRERVHAHVVGRRPRRNWMPSPFLPLPLIHTHLFAGCRRRRPRTLPRSGPRRPRAGQPRRRKRQTPTSTGRRTKRGCLREMGGCSTENWMFRRLKRKKRGSNA